MLKNFAAVSVLIAAIAVRGDKILWTGYANNNQWDTPTNWYPAQVPGATDDAVIHTGLVKAPNYVAINSLIMGDRTEGTANLTIYNTFMVTTSMQVYQYGFVKLNSGNANLQASATIMGGLTFASGTLQGAITVSGWADLSDASSKTLSGGVNAVLSGPSTIAGTLFLGGGASLVIAGTSTWNGLFIQPASSSSTGTFDTSKGGGVDDRERPGADERRVRFVADYAGCQPHAGCERVLREHAARTEEQLGGHRRVVRDLGRAVRLGQLRQPGSVDRGRCVQLCRHVRRQRRQRDVPRR